MLLRALEVPFGHITPQWTQLIVLVSIASMLLGSLAAIGQVNIKRLMAYSSIGHMGYALVGPGGRHGGRDTRRAGLHGDLCLHERRGVRLHHRHAPPRPVAGADFSDLSGLARTDPGLALAMAVFMFSMAGIPPFSGFFGKLYVFLPAVQSGYWTLAVIGVLTSVVGAFYYLRSHQGHVLRRGTAGLRRAPGLRVVRRRRSARW